MSAQTFEQFAGTLVKGARVNVLPPDCEHVMVREITSVAERVEYGKRWLIWYWKREGQTPWGTSDCGFGGQAIGDAA